MQTRPDVTWSVSHAHNVSAAAREELLEELRPLIVRAVRLVVGAGSWTAEDAAQEALLDVSQGIRRLRDPATVRAWAFKVATRRALKIARRERLRERLLVRGDLSVDGLQGTAPTNERQAALKQAFDHLPPRLRATAVLRLEVGMSERETAEMLSCSIGTVKSNLHDARKLLTESLTQAGYTPTVKPRKENSHGE